MKVLHISCVDGILESGSDARFLHESLPFYGVSSYLIARQRRNGIASYCSLRIEKFRELVKEPVYKECDLVHLHDVRGFLSADDLVLLKGKPILWSLTDSSVFTAGCTLSAHCTDWQKGCTDCFLFQDAKNKKMQAETFAKKVKNLEKLDITFTYANMWQLEQLKMSMVQKKEMRHMHLLHDVRQMYVGSKKEARKSLGLPLGSFVIIYHNELGGNKKKISSYFKTVMNNFKDDITPIFIVNIGSGELLEDTSSYAVRNVGILDAQLLGSYYRAANLNIYLSPEDIIYRPVIEAALCGLPSIVFDVGSAGEVIEDGISGYLIKSFDKEGLYRAVAKIAMQPQIGVDLGITAFRRYEYLTDNKNVIADYIKLYHEVLHKKIPLQPLQKDQPMMRKEDLKSVVQELLKGGMEAVEAFLKKQLEEQYVNRSKAEKKTYVNIFCYQCLQNIDIKHKGTDLWRLIAIWYHWHGAETKYEKQTHRMYFLEWAEALREVLKEYLVCKDREAFAMESTPYANAVVAFWRYVFLNVQSPLHLAAKNYQCSSEILQYQNSSGYPFIMLKSMYVPYLDDNGKANVSVLISSATIPLVMRFCMMFWLTSAPLYNGTYWQRKNILHYIREISHYMENDKGNYSVSLKRVLAEHCVISMWRLSYLGGNNIDTLKIFGRFIRKTAELLLPRYVDVALKKRKSPSEKLRIGYISLNFRNQAVSQYMANRLRYADHNKFFIKTFILNYHGDAMTEKIKSYSDEYAVFDNFQQLDEIAEAICSSELDLLVYADIGMDIITYVLGSLRLAPVQAVLVGHGTTTGLDSIDYYISGDHEPKDAQAHYTEKLIKLPYCGAAQLPPQKSGSRFSRAQIGVPEHAVVFISCANGLKHGPERDVVLVEILRRLPEAYIVLKPFMSPGSIDKKFSDRIMRVAEKAGVENRLKILDPLPKPGDLEGLYRLADIQLDTYPYGGWTTNLEALYYNLPIITQEGDMARNRWGAGLLRAMGIQEGIASNVEEYILWAQKLAEDHDLRKKVAQRIQTLAQEVLFNGKAAQESYEQVLSKIAQKKK